MRHCDHFGRLILYRVLQGILGAPIRLSQAIILSSFERRQHTWRRRSGGSVSYAADWPTIGGLSGSLQLALVFFMTFPIYVVSVFTVFVFITDRERNLGIRLDWTGFLALSIAVANFQLMIDRERLDWFDPVRSSSKPVWQGLPIFVCSP